MTLQEKKWIYILMKDNYMDGQFSLFDLNYSCKRPSDYRFKRYIGQFVHISCSDGDFIGKVCDIKPYYTFINVDGYSHILVGTPTTFSPLDRKDYL